MAPGIYALTGDAEVRAYAGFGAADPTGPVMDALIDAATDMLEMECDRHFMARDYAGWLDGSGMRYLTLPDWPLNSVGRVSQGTVDAFSVICNDTGATEAYAGITFAATVGVSASWSAAEFCRLVLLDGPNAATTDITLAANTPLSTLATAVSAVAGSWTGAVLGSYGDYRSRILRPVGRKECYGSFAYFQMPDYEAEDDYTVDYDLGQIVLPGGYGFSKGFRNVYIEYNAGYATVPAALRQICNELVVWLYRTGRRDLSLKSERLGDYAWTAAEGTADFMNSTEMQRRLAPFKDNVI